MASLIPLNLYIYIVKSVPCSVQKDEYYFKYYLKFTIVLVNFNPKIYPNSIQTFKFFAPFIYVLHIMFKKSDKNGKHKCLSLIFRI